MPSTTFNNRRRPRGQTLILAALAMVVLLLAVLFLFDLQAIIRTKVKTQTAADAAALAGANWQVHSLNLIGELNLIKACTALVTDVPPYGDDSPEGLAASGNLLTEMQARISFVGPVIGFGAAQQAAKNNGLNPVDEWGGFMSRNYVLQLAIDESTGAAVGENYSDWTRYGGHPKSLGGYSWRRPYRLMMENALAYGVTARPNAEGAMPAVDPPWLMDPDLYHAIAAKYWCYWTLRNLLKTYSFDGKWWDVNIVQDENSFIEESEVFPLYLTYTLDPLAYALAADYLDALAVARGLTVADIYNRDNPLDTDGINSPLPYLTWCIYDMQWQNLAPGEGWVEGGNELFLRSPLRNEFRYGGAVAKAFCQTDSTPISTGYWVAGNLQGPALVGGGVPGTVSGESSALAKPLGSLGEGEPPFLSIMILPVFTGARLIPVGMQDPGDNRINPELDRLASFLEWLSGVDDLDHPGSNPPVGTAGYLACLQRLNNEEWRSEGWNRNYLPGTMPTVAYNPITNPTGAGWLQMGRTYGYDASQVPVAILETNEDSCDYWPAGGSGSRSGPSVLH